MLLPLLLLAPLIVAAQKNQKCGPPDNVHTLPDYAQEEIKDLWRSWRSGSACDKELLLQNDVLSVIATIDEEENTHKIPPPLPNSSGPKLEHLVKPPPANIDYPDEARDGGSVVLLRPDRQQQKQVAKSRRPTNTDEDYIDHTTVDDVAMMRFDQGDAPFLKSADDSVKREFRKIWRNDDIPSEGLRALKIQTLAVSLLNAKQLEEYNSWATKRRRVLKAREQELRELSPAAKRALRRMSRKQRDEPVAVHPQIKRELRNFVERLNRRRSKKLLY